MDLVGYFRDIGRAAFKNDDPVKAGFDRNGSLLVAEAQGKYAAAARSGNLFHAAAPVLTIPATAGSLASVFTLVNPVGSPKTVELIEVDIAIILATTVVDGVALYEQSVAGGNLMPTTFTAGTPTNALIGAGSKPSAIFCTAATHIGALTLKDFVSTFGASTSTADNSIAKRFDGTIWLPPGSCIALAMTTTAWTASGLAAHISWAEWPNSLIA
jgi:hypothetical protein